MRVRGAAAVHGAEAEAVWETEERVDRAPSPDTSPRAAFTVRPQRLVLGAGRRLLCGGVRGREKQTEAAAEGEYVGCGPAFWGGGCLHSDTDHQYHINKRLKKSGRMQSKAARGDATGTGTGRTGRERRRRARDTAE